MKKVLVSLCAAALTILALANVAAATGSFGYQPELPSALKK